MLNHYNTELEGMRAFYDELGYPPEKIDYAAYTDGRLRIHNELGSLNELKLELESPLAVFKQMRRYIRILNSKAINLPKYGVYICINQKKYQVFLLDTDDFDHAKATELLDWNTPEDVRSWMEDTSIQLGWIDEYSLIAYSDRYFSDVRVPKTKEKLGILEAVELSLNGQEIDIDKKSKLQFVAELINPSILPIHKYEWNEEGDMERKLLDCLGPKELKKRLGAFFTPREYAVKSAEYIRKIIEYSDENDEFLIVDRCAGTGNLEEALLPALENFPKEKYKLLLNTIDFTERISLTSLFPDAIIFPEDTSTDENGLLLHGDALSEEFNTALKNKVEELKQEVAQRGHNLLTIFYENPPYAEPGAASTCRAKTAGNYVNTVMKRDPDVKGRASTDLSNQFIWSAFNLQKCDYYVVYSPIKYWKSQNLANKKFLYGFIADKQKFHATSSGVAVIAWKNEPENAETLELENTIVYKIHKGINEIEIPDTREEYICETTTKSGTPKFQNGVLSNYRKNRNAKVVYLGKDNILHQIPLFVANCYEPKGYLEEEVVFKSGDGGIAYQNDTQFLMDCFVWCGLSHHNKCLSSDETLNQYCFCQNTKADELVTNVKNLPRYIGLFNKWKEILREIDDCDERNPEWTYGLYQITQEVDISGFVKVDGRTVCDKTGKPKLTRLHLELHDKITVFRKELDKFFEENIEPKLFEHQLLK